MRKTLLIIAVLAFAVWVIGLYILNWGGLVHLGLLVSVIAFVIWLLLGDDSEKNYRSYIEGNETNY